MIIIKSTPVEIEVTSIDMAKAFCDMDEFEQVEFFNEIAENIKKWSGTFDYQLACMWRIGKLTPDAIKVMKLIGESVQ